RFIHLDVQSFWLDEVFSARIVEAPASNILAAIPMDKPPLEYYVQAFFSQFSDNKELVHRIPAAIAGCLFLIFAYLLASEIFSRRVAIVTLGLASFNTFLIAYSQEARPYSLSLLFVTMNLLCFVRWLRAENPKSAACIISLTLTALCSVFTLYAGIVVMVCELVVLLILAFTRLKKPGDMKRLAIFTIILAIISASLVTMHSRASIYPPKGFIWFFEKFTFGQFTRIYMHGLTGTLPLAPIYGATAGVIAALAGVKASLRPERIRPTLIVLTMMVTAFAIPFFYYVINRTVFPRYLLFLYPAIILVIAAGIDYGFSMFSNTRAGANALLVAGGMIYIPASVWFQLNPTDLKPDWRGVTRFISKAAARNDIIATTTSMETVPLEYYLNRFGRPDLKVVVDDGTPSTDSANASWVVSIDQAKVAVKERYAHLRVQFIRQRMPRVDYRAFLAQMKDGKKLFMGQTPDALLSSGWSFVELWERDKPMRWATGKQSTMFFPSNDGGAGEFVISCMPYIFRNDPSQSIGVVINGSDLEMQALPGDTFRDVTWKIPDGVMKSGYNRVTFKFVRVRPFAAVIDWVEWRPTKAETK
ncbi:MAG: glycosyltransferase family 39 protein, partial [Candidatus Sumerlaeota bacterium]